MSDALVRGSRRGPSGSARDDAPLPETGRASQVRAAMAAAAKAGLLEERTARISGRVSPALVAAAKRQTGIESDSELVNYALAHLAVEDPFVGAFREARGTVDPDLDLGY